MSAKRRILITGAGSGLGQALCKQLAGPDFEVIVTDKDGPAADQTRAMLPDSACAAAMRLDVTSEEDIARLGQRLAREPIHVLVNNAGLQYVASLESFPQERWDQLVEVMLKGTCAVTRAVLPGMRKQGFGRIVNIGSIHSLVASPFKSAYVAAKHGLLGFSKAIALETAEVDITVNTICPAYIRTPLVEAQIADQAATLKISEEEVIRKVMLEPMPKKSFITTEEVAGTIAFLLSDHARNITGQALVIDGGWTAR